MDDPKVGAEAHRLVGFSGHVIPVRSCAGAAAVRVIHQPVQRIAEHTHDWICVTLPLIGHAVEDSEEGPISLDGLAGVVHPPGAPHSDVVGPAGLETVSIKVDPGWLHHEDSFELDRTLTWSSGATVSAARRLAAKWLSGTASEQELASATAGFIREANSRVSVGAPSWITSVRAALSRSSPPSTAQLAHQLGLHPAWLAREFRRAVGEGVQEFTRRRRVERAVHLLRASGCSLADVAACSGFCDQAHMNRNFVAVLGRTPHRVRSEVAPTLQDEQLA